MSWAWNLKVFCSGEQRRHDLCWKWLLISATYHSSVSVDRPVLCLCPFLQHAETLWLVHLVHVCCVNWQSGQTAPRLHFERGFIQKTLDPAQQGPSSLSLAVHAALFVLSKQPQLWFELCRRSSGDELWRVTAPQEAAADQFMVCAGKKDPSCKMLMLGQFLLPSQQVGGCEALSGAQTSCFSVHVHTLTSDQPFTTHDSELKLWSHLKQLKLFLGSCDGASCSSGWMTC